MTRERGHLRLVEPLPTEEAAPEDEAGEEPGARVYQHPSTWPWARPPVDTRGAGWLFRCPVCGREGSASRLVRRWCVGEITAGLVQHPPTEMDRIELRD